ncbi:MAG: tetratricopeptide repeat protein [Chloroflexi bacterium]|nr:tetratricopeptide repeat protein [Chloroflexota bacterium]MCI0577746.1 tetratricopeptide repeat protein [Chloroflexota bacterium]MCI0644652.1 tetratricopeptide repeat protein [Chloroflexota bacterium]MCI0728036.1 tetratricopeptide repeat protein [Chloroflexota bacterium]
MANDRARYEQALSKGHAYGWDQRWPDAIREFQAAIGEFPQEPAPYAGLGVAYDGLNDSRKALENYKLAARYSQGDIIYLKPVAELQERLGQLNEAGQSYMAIGEVHLRQRKLDEAMVNWLRAVRLAPDLIAVRQRLAAVYQKQGQIRPAIHEYLAIARVLQRQGNVQQALETCQVALKMDPRNADVLTAIELIQQGEMLPAEGEAAPAPQPAGTGAADAKLPLPSLLEPQADEWQSVAKDEESSSPVQDARRMAMEQLAGVIFEEEEEDELLTPGRGQGLSKTERDALITQALDYQTRGMLNEAISSYERAITGGVTNTAAHFNLGLLYQDKLRFEDAIREFELSVQDQEYRLASHFALGESYRARGRIDKALEHFIVVLKIVDLDTVRHDQADRLIELYENLADSLMTKGEPEQATNFANALVEFLSHKGWEDKVKEARSRLDSLSSGGRTMILGDILTAGSEHVLESLFLSQEYARRGMFSSAMEETYRAIQLSPDYLPAHLQLAELLARQDRLENAVVKLVTVGDTYRARGDMNGAINIYERALELAPLDLSTRARLIELLKRHGRIDRSLEHYIAMGEAYYNLAQVDKARETYQEALKLAPRGAADKKWRFRLLRLIADIDMQRFDWKRALSAYVELRTNDQDDERLAINLIDLYYKVGQPESALRELDRYLIQLVKGGRGVKVTHILEDMVERRPADAGLIDRLAHLYIHQKRVKDAVNLLDKLGEAQLDAGQTRQAAVTIQKIIKLNPPNVTSYRQLLQRMQQDLA